MGWDEGGAASFPYWPSCVSPRERVSHRGVVVRDELPELRFKVGHRDKISATQTLSLDDAEYDLNLIEPRAVFRKVDKANSMSEVREELPSRDH